MNYKTYKIAELIDEIAMGPFGSNIKVECFVDEGIPVLNGSNLDGFILSEKEFRYVTPEKASSLKKANAARGDVVITHRGTLGQIVYIPQTSKYKQYVISQSQFRVRCNNKILPEYMVYYFHTTIGQHKLLSNASQVGVPALARPSSTFQQIEIEVPSIDVQRKVVAIFGAIQDKINCSNKINDNLEQQAATVFGDWLSKCTETASIGELSNNILDYTPIAAEMVRLLNSSDVTEGVFPVAPLVPNKDLKGHFKKRFQFDDILYSEIRPRNHHYGYVMFDASEYIASTRLMVIRAITSKVSPALLYQYLLLPDVEAEFTLKTESRSGTFPQGNYADMASIMVPYSSIESQSAVSDVLLQIRKTIAQNQLENRHLEELRDTLLPRLMSGEIDVSAIDI